MRGFALLFSLHFGPGARPDDGWLSADKAKHFFTSAVVQSMSFSALRSAHVSRSKALAGATVVSVSVGVGKEWYDTKFGGDPSVKDLAADGAGILVASLLLGRTER